MAYRIVEFGPRMDSRQSTIEIGAYDSAYHAMRVMKDEFGRRNATPLNWYLLDPRGQILARPDDVIDALLA